MEGILFLNKFYDSFNEIKPQIKPFINDYNYLINIY